MTAEEYIIKEIAELKAENKKLKKLNEYLQGEANKMAKILNKIDFTEDEKSVTAYKFFYNEEVGELVETIGREKIHKRPVIQKAEETR